MRFNETKIIPANYSVVAAYNTKWSLQLLDSIYDKNYFLFWQGSMNNNIYYFVWRRVLRYLACNSKLNKEFASQIKCLWRYESSTKIEIVIRLSQKRRLHRRWFKNQPAVYLNPPFSMWKITIPHCRRRIKNTWEKREMFLFSPGSVDYSTIFN